MTKHNKIFVSLFVIGSCLMLTGKTTALISDDLARRCEAPINARLQYEGRVRIPNTYPECYSKLPVLEAFTFIIGVIFVILFGPIVILKMVRGKLYLATKP